MLLVLVQLALLPSSLRGRLDDGLTEVFVGNVNLGEASCGRIGGAPVTAAGARTSGADAGAL